MPVPSWAWPSFRTPIFLIWISRLESFTQEYKKSTLLYEFLQDNSAIDALNKTCSNLQSQVESLQTSLSGVMQFMSAFSSFDINQEDIPKRYYPLDRRDLVDLFATADKVHKIGTSLIYFLHHVLFRRIAKISLTADGLSLDIFYPHLSLFLLKKGARWTQWNRPNRSQWSFEHF